MSAVLRRCPNFVTSPQQFCDRAGFASDTSRRESCMNFLPLIQPPGAAPRRGRINTARSGLILLFLPN
jgi:hypothetical protein